jgi:hypothetical protein
MRPCGQYESRTSYYLAVVHGQDVNGVLIIELVTLQTVEASQILPVSLHHVDLVAQSKMGQQLGLIAVPIGACDHMDHAFAPCGIYRGAKALLLD